MIWCSMLPLFASSLPSLTLCFSGGSANVEIDVSHSHSQFEALPTPTETEIMSPISTSSHSSMNNTMHHEWSNMGTASTSHYDNYFPVTQPEHGVYHKTTYHINWSNSSPYLRVVFMSSYLTFDEPGLSSCFENSLSVNLMFLLVPYLYLWQWVIIPLLSPSPL